jgi:gliding motility-associated-like protein
VIDKISKAQAQAYSVTVTVKGCTSEPGTVLPVIVSQAIANAGSDQTVCANNGTVQLTGTITGEDTRDGIWRSDGSGVFVPGNTALITKYIPGITDTANGMVRLTLASANNQVCPVSQSSILVTITDAPRADAGTDITVCANDSLISLQGAVFTATGGAWRSSGSGRFSPANSGLTTVYIPSRQDIIIGNVNLYLTTTGNGSCLAATDTLRSTIVPVPYVNAGADRIIFENDIFVFSPEVKGTDLQYLWTPNVNLNNNKLKNAVLVGKNNETYLLTVTGAASCVSQDEIFVRVLKPIKIPNIFSPNGDGIYDEWNIPEIANYPGAIVEVYTRTGQKIFSSQGYQQPWNGTFNGKPVPVATYYYIINPKFGGKLFSGSITITR